jgi:hypothetical protein
MSSVHTLPAAAPWACPANGQPPSPATELSNRSPPCAAPHRNSQASRRGYREAEGRSALPEQAHAQHRCDARPQWAHPIPRCPPDR